MVRLECAGETDVGQRRSNNEDTIIVRPDLAFVALADGMGGAASGELASRIFVDVVASVFSDRALKDPSLPASDTVQKAFLSANRKVWETALNHHEHKGMGCTAEILSFDEEGYALGHVGDSRTYLLRNGNLRQLTKDHSVVQEQVDQGLITPEEARTHALRNIILRALGVGETVAVDLIRGKTQQDDLFLLCSDGLTDMVDDTAIGQILTSKASLDSLAHRLVEAANKAGGSDNISVVLCRVSSC